MRPKRPGEIARSLHDGIDCRLADGTSTVQQSGPAARLVELIHSPDADETAGRRMRRRAATDFGSYLPRESISAALAETCQELRRFLEQRGHCEERRRRRRRCRESAAP